MTGTFDRVRAMVAAGNVRVSEHGFQELEEDGIFPDEVIGSVGSGLIVEDYPDAWKGPTVLVRQTLVSRRHIHVVWGFSKANDRLAVLITAYFPDSSLWSPDFLSKERS